MVTTTTNNHKKNNTNDDVVITNIRDHYSMGVSTELRFRGSRRNGNGNGKGNGTSTTMMHILDDVGRDQQLVVTATAMVKEQEQDRAQEHDQKIMKNGNSNSNNISNDAFATAVYAHAANTSSTNTSTTTTHHNITIQMNTTGTFGTGLLRAMYVFVSFFILSCLFAFSIQCILFLFMNVIATTSKGEWDASPPRLNVTGSVLACPLLLYSLSAMMTMSWACVVDCWRGLTSHPLSLLKVTQFVKQNSNSHSSNSKEWIFVTIFVGIPLLGCGISTFINDTWYEMTLLVWAGSSLVFQCCYMELCLWNEVIMCQQLLQHFYSSSGSSSWIGLLKMNLILTQRQKYSGVRNVRYLVKGDNAINSFRLQHLSQQHQQQEPVQVKYSFGTRWWTKGVVRCCYDNLEQQQPHEVEEDDVHEEEEEEEKQKQQVTARKGKRNYTIDEVFGNVTISTQDNWNLQRLFCIDQTRVTSLTVTGSQGEGSVTPLQFIASYICFALAMIFVVVVLVGILLWLDKSIQSTILIAAFVILICFYPCFLSLLKVRQYQTNYNNNDNDNDNDNDVGMGNDNDELVDNANGGDDEEMHAVEVNDNKQISSNGNTNNNDDDDDDCCQTLLSVWESIRITELKPWACYTLCGVELLFFFLWPVISLFYFENTPVAIVFLIFSLHSIPRHYFNVSNLLQELGSLDDLDLSAVDLSLLSSLLCCLGSGSGSGAGGRTCIVVSKRSKEIQDLKNKALVANLVKRVTRSRANGNWMGLFFVVFIGFLIGFYISSSEDEAGFEMGRYKKQNIKYVDAKDFYWDPQPQLPYPTCDIKKGVVLPGQNDGSLANFSFLASMAYFSPEVSQPFLDQWFGSGLVIDDHEYVTKYRLATGTATHPVSYKLFTIANDPTSAIVSIRGSEAMWDWMVDAQLWTGGALVQVIKNAIPLGFLWDPILDEVCRLINCVQSYNLKQVSYYRYTTNFIEALYEGFEGRAYTNLRVTGTSLGGGLALLTGAITGASAICFSALNAMFSRRTFLPPITVEQLNTRVFNVIPQRDIIANIDRPGRLYQRIQCRGPKNDWFACHSMFRTLCEIQYQCGSQGKPINCLCVSKYGYPIPTQNGTVTWEDTCAGYEPK